MMFFVEHRTQTQLNAFVTSSFSQMASNANFKVLYFRLNDILESWMCLAFFAAYISCRNDLLSSCSLDLYVLYIMRFTGNSWGSAGKLWSWFFGEGSRKTLPCWSWLFCDVSRQTLPFWYLFLCEVCRKTLPCWSSFLCDVSRKTLRFWSSILIVLAVPGHCFLLLHGIFRGSASDFIPFCLVCWTSFLARKLSRRGDHFLVRFSQGLPWNRFKGEIGETSKRRGGAHMSFSKRKDNILNWTVNEFIWESLPFCICDYLKEINVFGQ